MSVLLPTRTVEKVWGRKELPAPISNPGSEPVGEIWFEPPEALLELLVKYIFASEKLSVQTHPDDDQAEAAERGRQGKEECWIILDAEPGATIAVGFKEGIDSDAMRKGALDGSIEGLLHWHEVSAGEFFYIPANTVHAIGGGVSLLEVQQNSDTAYRLYDYGRPCELHFDEAIAVAKDLPPPAELRWAIPETGGVELVDDPYLRLERVDGAAQPDLDGFADAPLLVMPTRGTAQVGVTVASAAYLTDTRTSPISDQD